MTIDLLRTRHPFLDDKHKRMLIDGKWGEAASGRTFESINPSTGKVLARVAECDAEDIERLQLELGGKSPDVVFADADIEAAVPGAAMTVFNNSRQVCSAGTRMFVERKIYQEFSRHR